jgi:uncharacterized BrkB/YihY/UPF0761 family membrane protein
MKLRKKRIVFFVMLILTLGVILIVPQLLFNSLGIQKAVDVIQNSPDSTKIAIEWLVAYVEGVAVWFAMWAIVACCIIVSLLLNYRVIQRKEVRKNEA